MRNPKKKVFLSTLLSATLAVFSLHTGAEDIDIFVGSSAGSGADPKILIILDNSANWSRASQKWPGGLVQGQAEARAIQTLVGESGGNIKMGLMEFATSGSGHPGGFIRKSIAPLDAANKAQFSSSMTTIFNGINSPNEKVASSFGYGDLMYSAFNYFSGAAAIAPSTTVVSSLADTNGYTSNYSTFRSPLSDDNACGRNFVIFIGNNVNGAVDGDTPANSSALVSLGGSVSPQLPYTNYTTSTSTTSANLGYTSQCFASLAACSTADYATQCAVDGAYSSCTCNPTNTTTSLDACAAGQSRFAVYGNTNTGGTTSTVGPTAQTPVTNTGGISSCYATSAAASTAVTSGVDKGGMTCPAGTTTTAGNVTTTTTNSCTYALTSTTPSVTATQNCPSTAGSPVLGLPVITTATATTTTCYGGISVGNPKWNTSGDNAGLVCPGPSVVTVGTTTTTTTYTCTYAGALAATCGGGKNRVLVTQTITGSPSSVTTAQNKKYDVTQRVTPSVTTVTLSGVTTTQTLLGNSTLCYASGTDAVSSPQFSPTCSTYNGGCSSGAGTSIAGQCLTGARFMVTGNIVSTSITPTGGSTIPTDGANADEWARFLHQPKAKNIAQVTDTIKQSITTYTIDVFNAQQDAQRTALLQSMANAGGGKYFQAKSEAEILLALRKIIAQIQSVNSTFASASLPVNATNRTQSANQVFIGMFRPDPNAEPRWFGNLKQYAIGKINGALDLVDSRGNTATNPLTGFVDDCATSFWTTDSSNYWSSLLVPINPDPASNCPSVAPTALYSDLPDGPTVEKGAAAEVLRKGNDPSATTPTNNVNRNILTVSGSALVTFSAATSGLSDAAANNIVGYTQGKDVNNDTGAGGPATSRTRPSIHGDVVHSRPLPINYGASGVTVYYGANDGTYRAVDATNAGAQGKERWALIGPEFFPKLQRLKDNQPLVSYPSVVALGLPSLRKDYFFDGSTGLYQTGDNSRVWIYPTQRRGGRMLYALDVSNPASNPTLLWRHGCPNLNDDSGCTTGGTSYAAIGQTWSTPNVAFIKGFSTTTPVLVVGGGYDGCEDEDTNSPSCGSAKGRVIYVINAQTGDIIRSFPTSRSVAADVSLVDVNNDGFVDYAYAADVGGSIYRIDFVDGPLTLASLGNVSWTSRKLAATTGGARKFQFTPAVFNNGTTTYLAIVSGDRERPLIANYPYTGPVLNRAYVYRDDLAELAVTPTVDLDGASMLNLTDSTAATCDSASLLQAVNANKKGWYMSLNANGRGEQGVTAAVIVGGMVTFSTNRPVALAQSCGSALGEARGYFVNLFNASGTIATANNAACGGNRSSVFPGGGLPPSPVFGVVPIDGVPTAVLIGAVQRDGTTGSPIKPSKVTPPISQIRTRTYKSIKGDQ